MQNKVIEDKAIALGDINADKNPMKNTSRLPNLRNLGVALRILIIANLALILGAVILSDGMQTFMYQLTGISTFAQPTLLISLFLLYSGYPLLHKISYERAITATFILVALSAAAVHAFFSQFWIFTELPSLHALFYMPG